VSEGGWKRFEFVVVAKGQFFLVNFNPPSLDFDLDAVVLVEVDALGSLLGKQFVCRFLDLVVVVVASRRQRFFLTLAEIMVFGIRFFLNGC